MFRIILSKFTGSTHNFKWSAPSWWNCKVFRFGSCFSVFFFLGFIRNREDRSPNASAVEELRRYASFIGTSNHKDLLTDTSGSRRFIGVEVTGVIDVVRPIDYEQLYAQAMALLRSNERYWFDEKEEAIMTEANREFEQSPVIEQLFQVYYRAAEEEEEGEWLLAADILQRIQKASKMKFSSGQVNYFGRILQRLGVKSFRKTRGVYYHVVPVE